MNRTDLCRGFTWLSELLIILTETMGNLFINTPRRSLRWSWSPTTSLCAGNFDTKPYRGLIYLFLLLVT